MTDHAGRAPSAGQGREGARRRLGRDHRDEPEAEVEGALHLVFADTAAALHQIEDRRAPPAVAEHHRPGAVRQDPREVSDDASAGDVGQRLGPRLRQKRFDGRGVDDRRAEQGLAERLAQGVDGRAERQAPTIEQGLSGQRIAVAVEPARSHADEHVARDHAASVDDRCAIDHPHREARQIVFARVVEARELSGLPADQRHIGLLAALSDPGNHGLRHVDLELPGAVVVEEEERERAGGEHIVDAHGDQIDAHGGVAAELKGDLELGADPVGPRDDQGVVHRLDRGAPLLGRQEGLFEGEQGGETADPAHDPAPMRAFSPRADAIDEGIAEICVHARVFVGQTAGGHGRKLVSSVGDF